MAKPSPVPTAAMPVVQLRDALKRVIHAAASDDARPILASIAIQAHEVGLRMVAADNYRIAILPVACKVEDGPWPPTVVHTHELKVVRALLAECAASDLAVLSRPGPGRLRVETTLAAMDLRPIDGTYPDVDLVIASARDAQRVVSLNARYLADVAKGMSKDGTNVVELRASDPLAPVAFVDATDGYLEVVMPVRTTEDGPYRPAPRDHETPTVDQPLAVDGGDTEAETAAPAEAAP